MYPCDAAGALRGARARVRRVARVGARTRPAIQRRSARVDGRSARVAKLRARHSGAAALPRDPAAATRLVARTRPALERDAATVRCRAARDALGPARRRRARPRAADVRSTGTARLSGSARSAGQHPAASIGDIAAVESQPRTRRGDARARVLGGAGEAGRFALSAIELAATPVVADAATVVEVGARLRHARVDAHTGVGRGRVDGHAAVGRSARVGEPVATPHDDHRQPQRTRTKEA